MLLDLRRVVEIEPILYGESGGFDIVDVISCFMDMLIDIEDFRLAYLMKPNPVPCLEKRGAVLEKRVLLSELENWDRPAEKLVAASRRRGINI